MRHLVVPTWALAPWGLALAGRPLAAATAAAVATARFALRLPDLPGVRREGAKLGLQAHGHTARQVFDQLWRVHPAPMLASRRARYGLVASIALDWHERRPRLDPVRYGALRIADDTAYAAGVWLGCLRARQAAPLLPLIARSQVRVASAERDADRVHGEVDAGEGGERVERLAG